MRDPKYKLNQEVWITNKRWFQSLTSREVQRELFDISSCKISAIVLLPDRENYPSYGNNIGYCIVDDQGNEVIYEHDFDIERMKAFPEKVVCDSYESAVLEVINMINQRIGDLESLKQEYVNKIEEYRSKHNLLDDDLFQMQD